MIPPFHYGMTKRGLYSFHLQSREIRYCKSIGSIIRLRDFTESEYHHECLLDLRFLGKPISCDSLLHLKRRELYYRYTMGSKGMKDDSSGMCDIDTIGDISQEKESLDSADRRMVCVDELSEIVPDLEKPLGE